MSLLGQMEAPEKISPRAEVEKAYEFFKAHAWIKGANYDTVDSEGTWGFCLQGAAIYYGTEAGRECFCGGHHPTSNPNSSMVLHYLEKALPPEYEGFLPRWNDAEGRTREDVDFLWQKAIVLAHMEETGNEQG